MLIFLFKFPTVCATKDTLWHCPAAPLPKSPWVGCWEQVQKTRHGPLRLCAAKELSAKVE